MLSVNQLTVQFGGKYLFEEISFLVNTKDRIGLTGKNGAGKSTLLKIIAGLQQPESGTIAKPNGFKIGYLPQEMVHNLGKTVFAETETAFAEVKAIQSQLDHVNEQLTIRTDYESEEYHDLIHKINDLNDRLNILGAYNLQAEIETVLMGLGFDRNDLGRLTDEFSGGWRMRVELAKILLQKPDILLLDEPTNHLDIEAIQWLEEFLKNYNGAIILISHDRAFLDNITNRTIEISMGQIFDYKANYSKYLILRKERRDQQMAEAKNQEKFIEHTQQLIDKYRAKANKAAFAQSLIKKLDKLERVEVDDEDNVSIHFRFPEAPHSGKVTVLAENIHKHYGEKHILKGLNFEVERGEKIAFVGRNGEGKTTLSKIIVGQLDYEGNMTLGHQVHIGYFGQTQAEQLNGDKTVFETLDDIAVGDVRTKVRNILGSFLFGGDDVDKKVKVLSGGEKTRLALAQLLLKPYNLLVLDEPTNHLDIRSKDILKQALINFNGTLIIVSHDRDFLQGLTNKVFEFKTGNIKVHIGDVNEYLRAHKLESFKSLELKQKPVIETKKEPVASESYEQKKEQEKEQRKIKNAIDKSEKEIEQLENKLKLIDEELLDPEKYKKLIAEKDFYLKYDALKKQLETEYQKWEELQTKLV